jgi:hypothetical protein
LNRRLEIWTAPSSTAKRKCSVATNYQGGGSCDDLSWFFTRSASVSGTLHVPSIIEITLPHRDFQSFPFQDFLVRTRSKGNTLVNNNNRITVEAGVRQGNIDGDFRWTINGSAVSKFDSSAKSFKTASDASKTLNLHAKRHEDGFGKRYSLKLNVSASVKNIMFSHQRIIRQSTAPGSHIKMKVDRLRKK